MIGDVQRMLDADWVAAEASYAEALALNPSNETALRSYGLMLALESRYAEALDCVDRARELDPLCLATSTTATWARYVSGDYDGAIAQCRHTLEMDPEFVNAHRVLAAALLQAGRADEAAAQLELALTFADSHPVLLAWLAHVKAVMGCRTQAARADRARPRARGHDATCRRSISRWRIPGSVHWTRRSRRSIRRGSIAIPRSRCSTPSRVSSRSEVTRAIAR